MHPSIEDQITDYMAQGKPRSDAEEEAIQQMGDPVESIIFYLKKSRAPHTTLFQSLLTSQSEATAPSLLPRNHSCWNASPPPE